MPTTIQVNSYTSFLKMFLLYDFFKAQLFFLLDDERNEVNME